jgi:hypothetical protein
MSVLSVVKKFDCFTIEREMTLQAYAAKIVNSIMSREGFVVSEDGFAVQPNGSVIGEFISSAFIFVILMIGFFIATCYGAARLSYCYNVSTGNADSAMLYSVLCFLFPAFYYPYYALFLNSVCAKKSNSSIGGRRWA